MGKVLYTDGNWRLRRGDANLITDLGGLCIEHSCVSSSRHPWHTFAWTLPYRDRRCGYCQKPPPEGIQAMFWFLKEGSYRD
jgi:hypothetical protein